VGGIFRMFRILSSSIYSLIILSSLLFCCGDLLGGRNI
jgi:hypothetical protein